MPAQAFSTVRLVNGSTGDPVLYLDYPGRDDAILFDGGENDRLTKDQLGDVQCVFVTHHHVDHFTGTPAGLTVASDSRPRVPPGPAYRVAFWWVRTRRISS